MNPNDPLDDTQGSSVPPFLPEPGSAFARNSLLPAGGSVGGQYHQPQASDRYRSTGSYRAPEYTRPAAQPLPAYDSGYPGAYGGPGRAGEGLGYSVGPIGGSGLEGGDALLAHTSRLQQQLARQTGDMQRYLQGEIAKVSEAFHPGSAHRDHSPFAPPRGMSPPLFHPPSVALPLVDPLAHHHSLPPVLYSPVQLHPPPLELLPPPKSFPSLAGVPAFVDRRHVNTDMADIVFNRVASPVWDENHVHNSQTPITSQRVRPDGTVATAGLTPLTNVVVNLPPQSSHGSPSQHPAVVAFDSADTSVPGMPGPVGNTFGPSLTLPMAHDQRRGSAASDRRSSSPLGGYALTQNRVQQVASRFRSSLLNVEEAHLAMGYAQSLAALDQSLLVDIIRDFQPNLERKEIAITWKAIVGAYEQQAKAVLQGSPSNRGRASLTPEYRPASMPNRNSRSLHLSSGSPQGGYEMDDSLPPTPRFGAARAPGDSNYETTLQEVMNFIDQPLSPQSLQRMVNVRAREDPHSSASWINPSSRPAAAYSIPIDDHIVFPR